MPVILDPGSGGSTIATDTVGGQEYQLFHPVFGDASSKTRVSSSDPLPVAVGGTVAVTGPLTDAQLRASPVPVSGTVAVSAVGGSVAVTGPLTDAQLRAAAVPVSGTFWQATQPVSLASVPTHAVTQGGAWTADVSGSTVIASDGGGSLTVDGTVAVSSVGGTVACAQSGTWNVGAVTTLGTITNVVHVDDNAGSLTVDGTVAVSSVGGTVAVSAASLPLPAGASTAAKQPALGTAGSASADVITVQGIASMTALKVDGSAVTQPVSGTVAVSAVGGTVAATQSGTWNVGTVTTITNAVHVDDNGGSLTVDAPVGTPVFVRLSDGSSAIATLPVSLASVPTHAVTQSGTWSVSAAGDVAHDAVDSGSPLKIGGYARTNAPTFVADGDRVNAWFSLAGALGVHDANGSLTVDGSVTADTELSAAAAAADAAANPTAGGVLAFGMLFNGSTWDRQPGAQEGTLLASGTRSSTQTVNLPTNYGWSKLLVWLYVTANPGGAQTLTVTVQGQDAASGNWNSLNGAGTALNLAANNGAGIEVSSGGGTAATAGTNRVAERTAAMLPKTARVVVTHSGAGSWTYSLGYAFMP